MEEECVHCILAELNASAYDNDTHNDTTINKFYFYQTAQLALLWILLVTIIIGNSTVVLALYLTRSRKSRMNFFVMQLAIADLWVGLVNVLPDLVQRITISWFGGSAMCKLTKYLQGVVTYSSTYVLVALSLDRCDAITRPMNFSRSWRRARVLVASAWFISFIFCVPMLFLFNEADIQGTLQCWLNMNDVQWQIWMTSIFVTLFVAPAGIISTCYCVIVITIRQKSRTVLSKKKDAKYSDEMESRRESSRGIIPKAKIKTVKMTFVIVFVFVICWSPYMIFDLLQVYGYVPVTQANIAMASLIQSLAPLNSAANPVIYLIFSRRIFLSLRNIPPYKWFWCTMNDDGPIGRESRPNTELLTSSHRRTRHELTLRVKNDSMKCPKRLHQSSRKLRIHLPDNQMTVNNNNFHAQAQRRHDDTFL